MPAIHSACELCCNLRTNGTAMKWTAIRVPMGNCIEQSLCGWRGLAATVATYNGNQVRRVSLWQDRRGFRVAESSDRYTQIQHRRAATHVTLTTILVDDV